MSDFQHSKQESPEVLETEKWRKFDILLSNFQAIGKWQSRLVNMLFAFLCLTWGVDLLHRSGEITLQILGATIQVQGFWQIVPLVTSVLSLGLIGSFNVIHHAWRRLDLHIPEIFSDPSFFFTEFDVHKNILDYFAYLTLSFRKPVLPDTADDPKAEKQQWNLRLLLYPGLIFASFGTSLFTLRRIEVDARSLAYVLIFSLLQLIFSLPFTWRKLCLFVGLHKSPYEGMDWGDVALYKMSMKALERMIKRHP